MGRRTVMSGRADGQRHRRRGLPGLIGTVAALTLLPAAAAQAATWNVGDVFAGASTSPAEYRVFDNAGNFKEAFSQAGTDGFATGCGFTADDDLWGTFFSANRAVKFANAHPHGDLQTLDVTPFGASHPESVVFAANGDFYVGNADGNGNVLKYNSAGTFQQQFAVERNRGSDFVELALDQHTLLYNSEDETIRRYDVATDTQLTPFATGLPSEGYGLRLLPPGDGSGGLLTAQTADVKRLDASGAVVQSYDAPGENLWFALNLDPNGTSFWSADLSTGNIYRFNIASGAIEVGPIPNPGVTIGGLCVLGEPTAAVPPPPTPPGMYAECPNAIDGKSVQGDDTDETITGTDLNDLLRGGGGNDSISGLPGDDCINGQDGNDTLSGNDGADLIVGEDGDDSAGGGGGNDTIDLGNGNDSATGDSGNDTITGGSGNDDIDGVDDNDLIKGFGGDDVVDGGNGNDRVQGSGGDDRVSGDEGKDKVRGGTGNDRVKGGAGNDQVQSQGGQDKVVGGSGKDNIRAGGGDDKVNAVDGVKDKVKCGTGNDVAKVDKVDKVAKDCNKVKVSK